MVADCVITEPGLIVPMGVILPDTAKTPSVLVDQIIERAA